MTGSAGRGRAVTAALAATVLVALTGLVLTGLEWSFLAPTDAVGNVGAEAGAMAYAGLGALFLVLNRPPSATARLLTPRGVLIPNSIGNTGGLLAGLPRMARAMLVGLGRTTVKTATLTVNRDNLGGREQGQQRLLVRVLRETGIAPVGTR